MTRICVIVAVLVVRRTKGKQTSIQQPNQRAVLGVYVCLLAVVKLTVNAR